MNDTLTKKDTAGTNALQNIFGALWAVWGLLVFTITMLAAIVFFIPCFILKEPAAAKWHRMVSRVWMVIFLNLIGCPLRVKGAANFQPHQPYVVVCNHNSLMDVPITTPFMPHANKTIAKKEFAYVPVFGWIYAAGSVLVNRNSEKSRRQSFDKMKQVLRQGLDMVIYPEGTRNKTNQPLKAFYDGAFKLAVDMNTPVIPALIFNTKKVLPPNKAFFLRPCPLQLHFLPPVEPGLLNAKQLKEKVYQLMWDYYSLNERSRV